MAFKRRLSPPPFEARKVRIVNVGLFNLCKSLGLVGHEWRISDMCDRCLPERTQSIWNGLSLKILFYNTHVSSLEWQDRPEWNYPKVDMIGSWYISCLTQCICRLDIEKKLPFKTVNSISQSVAVDNKLTIFGGS